MLEHAVSKLDLSKPQGLIMQDIMYNEMDSGPYESKLFPPSREVPKEVGDLSLFDFVESNGDNTEITTTDNQAINNPDNKIAGFDYNNYSDPNYLSNVAGRTITMPNGEVRSYSKDGSSYSIPAESWMGIGNSHYQITTHNKLSGAPQPINKQYVGISEYDARPFYMAAATAGIGGPAANLTKPATQGLRAIKASGYGEHLWNFVKEQLSGSTNKNATTVRNEFQGTRN